jgi:small redox-active disulfide protein 2
MRRIAVLGPGCPRCHALAENAEKAVRESGIECDVIRVTSIDEILEYDVLMTPGLVIDGNVKLVGRVATVDEIKQWLLDDSPADASGPKGAGA